MICDEYYGIRLVQSLTDKNFIDIYNCYRQKTFDPNPLAHISYNDFIKIDNLYFYLNNLHKNYKNRNILSRCQEVGFRDIDNICKTHEKDLQKITVSLQKRCNLNCIMCHNSIQYEDPIIHKLYFDTLYKIKNNHLNRIEFTEEGEPFYYKDEMFTYLDTLTNNDCKSVKIVTNLTMLNDTDIYHLYDIKRNKNIDFNFMFSIDGITEETYKKIRKNNLFNKVIHNAELLISLGFNCMIHFVVMPENLHELSLYKQFWHEKGIIENYKIIACVIFDYCHPMKNATQFVLSSKEWKEYNNNNADNIMAS